MPFDNFYNKSDNETHRHWKSVISTFLLVSVIAVSLTGLYSIYDDYKIKHDNEVEQTNRINRIDALCTNLPKPEQLNFIKREQQNGQAEIIYHYQTERNSAEILPLFLSWFTSNNWKRTSKNELNFEKYDQIISIKSSDNYYTKYDIYCSDSEISFGIYD